MKRLLGIDYGKRRLGLALSDERQWLASPLCTVEAGKSHTETCRIIEEKIAARGPIEAIVVGLPLLLSGKEGEMSQEVRLFASHLEKRLGLPIIFWDERLTSMQVERTMKEAEMNRKQRSQLVDTAAAAAILQNYLDSR